MKPRVQSLVAGQVLKKIFEERRKSQSDYSLRAFAREIGLSHTLLSLVMNGKKDLSIKSMLKICQVLGAENAWTGILLNLIQQSSALKREAPTQVLMEEENSFFILEHDKFRLLKDWYHIAILDLTQLDTFKPSVSWISEQLGISPLQAEFAVNRLVRLGLLKIEGKKWKKTHQKMTISPLSGDEGIKAFHKQMISKALQKLEASTPENTQEKDITAITIPADPRRLKEARKKIERFRKQMLSFLAKDGHKTELFQLNVQLFSLNKKLPTGEKHAH